MNNSLGPVPAELQRHFVGIDLAYKYKGDLRHSLASAFILSVEGQWFLVTAGHCIQDLDAAIKDKDVTALECALIDEVYIISLSLSF